MRKILSFYILFFVSISIFSQPTDSLVGHWPFNNNFEDASGYQNHGYPSGCAFIHDRFNQPNSAVYFDGIEDIITIADNPNISFDAFKDEFTISFWFKTSDANLTTSSARFIEKWDGILSTPYPHSIIIKNDLIKAAIYDTVSFSLPQALGFFTDEWFHVVMVNDIEADSIKLYIDAQLIDIVENESISSCGNNVNLTFGNNLLKNRPYYGAMDDIRFYSRVLNDSEITELYEEDPFVTVENIASEKSKFITPNPTQGKVSIESELELEKVEVFDLTGIKRITSNKKTVDLSSLPKGLYYIRVKHRAKASFETYIVVKH